MREAEQALSSLRMTMTTVGRLRGGLDVTTRGELRVLRTTQPAERLQLFTHLEYAFGDGLKGVMETAWTADGIATFEQDPAFGEILLHFDPSVVADLEWAGGVLQRSDLPGMADARAQAPLGSGLLHDLVRTFDLTIGKQREHAGDVGTWVLGRRKPGLDEQDPELPLADKVELFVRDRDRALVVARYLVGEHVVQQVVVEHIEIGIELPADAFTVDDRGLRRRQVQLYQPMWEQIEQILVRAEAKAKDGELRPSKR